MRNLILTAAAAIMGLSALAGDPGVESLCASGGDSDSAAYVPPLADSIIVDKATMTMTVYGNGGTPVSIFDVATGRIPGNKVSPGDMRTPEGRFLISEITDASGWTHDFGDGLGEIEGCYGPWFIRLDTPGHTGIGIHGTHLPASLGRRASEGCIRLLNEHCDSLRHMVAVGIPVIILPGAPDREVNEIIEAERALMEADTLALSPSVPLSLL